ncbi:hypothetical protein MRX96_023176 [Rhipicephalus microplus]
MFSHTPVGAKTAARRLTPDRVTTVAGGKGGSASLRAPYVPPYACSSYRPGQRGEVCPPRLAGCSSWLWNAGLRVGPFGTLATPRPWSDSNDSMPRGRAAGTNSPHPFSVVATLILAPVQAHLSRQRGPAPAASRPGLVHHAECQAYLGAKSYAHSLKDGRHSARTRRTVRRHKEALVHPSTTTPPPSNTMNPPSTRVEDGPRLAPPAAHAWQTAGEEMDEVEGDGESGKGRTSSVPRAPPARGR